MLKCCKPKKVAYIETELDYYDVFYELLNPTGRYMYKSGPRCDDIMYIEHEYSVWFFKKWIKRKFISENNIVFLPEQKEEIYICDKAK